MKKKTAPGKAHREGLSLIEATEMFATEDMAREWIESIIWEDGRFCPHCGSDDTSEASHRKMPYWCSDCRSYFSVKTGTPLSNSKVPLRKWALAIYLCLTSLKSISSMKLHRDLKVTQKTAWFMLQRIREVWMERDGEEPFDGPVEADETYMGGKRKNMPHAKRKALKDTGRGAVGKTAVAGIKDRKTNKVRARVVERTDKETLHGFVEGNTDPDARVFTDEFPAYKGMDREHEAVKHKDGEYVRDEVHTQGIESVWAMFKRAQMGTFHKLSPKHMNRYVQEFAEKHNMRDLDTLAQMRDVVGRLFGRSLDYRTLVADNGLDSGARS